MGHRVGEQDLLGHPEREERHAAREDVHGVRRPELFGQSGVAQDRPGHQVREERDEAEEVDRVPQRPRVPAVDVDAVAHRLERVERDADRQRDVQRGTTGGARPRLVASAFTLAAPKSKY